MSRIYRFEDAEWHVPIAPGTDPRPPRPPGRAGRGAAVPRAGRRRLLHPGRADAARLRGAAAQHTTTARCSWCSRAAARSTASRWRASTSRWSKPTSRTAFTAGPDGLSFLVVRQGRGRDTRRRRRSREHLRPHRPRRLRRRRHRAAPAARRRRRARRPRRRARRASTATTPARRSTPTASIVAPGIVDAHTHYDPQITFDPVRDDVVLPRRHHRRGRQLRVLGGAVQARGPRLPHRASSPESRTWTRSR